MRTVTGLFDTRGEAESAMSALRAAGINSDDISLVRPGHDNDNDTAQGIGVGAAVGGVLGALATFAIPGVGPVVGAGWLAATLAGAAAGGVAGGLIGALSDAGVDEADAHVYAESIRRGSSLVTARVDETQADAAQAILNRSGSVDLGNRREQYTSSGWDRFDETGGLWTGDSDQRPLGSSGSVPPVR